MGEQSVTEDPSALRRCIVACPEVSQLVLQYASGTKESIEQTSHHEQTE
jgi:hypothetical protein